jgi:proteasome beta subunit
MPLRRVFRRFPEEGSSMEPREVETGTTTLGLACKDGVVLAADRRATAGTMIAHKRTKKVYKIDDNLGLTTAGLVGDLQLLARYITAEAELYKLKRNLPMSVEAAATLTANILSGRRYFPYWVQLVLGGVDGKGNHVFSLDMAGGSLEDKYVSTGSGSPYVYGVLEDHWTDDTDVKAGIDLAVRAVSAAIRRDAASGEGIDVAVISREGYRDLDEKEVERRKAAMKIP